MGSYLSSEEPIEVNNGVCAYCTLTNHNTPDHICSICGIIGEHSAMQHCKRCGSLEHAKLDHKCWCDQLGHTHAEHWNLVRCETCDVFGHSASDWHTECDRCDLVLINHEHAWCDVCSNCTVTGMHHIGTCVCGGCLIATYVDPDETGEIMVPKCITCYRTPDECGINLYDITKYGKTVPRKRS